MINEDFDLLVIQKGDKIKGYSLINDKKLEESVCEKQLSSREIEILKLIVLGLSNKEISNSLEISTNTVKNHLYNIFKKLEVSDRTQAAVAVMKNQVSKNVSRETFDETINEK